jgi:DNA gyrase/topoisomerase IV subunit A
LIILSFQGGKDHASSRYIYTELNTVTRCLFHEDDDKLLEYLNEDGKSIEPNWYFIFSFSSKFFAITDN